MLFDQKLCNHNFTNRMMIKQENDAQTKYIVQAIFFLCPKISFCKLDHIKLEEKSRSLMKRSSLLKRLSNFAPKRFIGLAMVVSVMFKKVLHHLTASNIVMYFFIIHTLLHVAK
jgi:hypothetical protein